MPALATKDAAGGQATASRASTPSGQMRAGFRWLRFDSGLESAYARGQFLDGVVRLRVGLVVLLAMTLALFQVDQAAMPEIAGRMPAAARGLGIVHADSPAGGRFTISIGVATVVPQSGRSSAGLLQLADQALYAAKDRGRNQARSLEGEYEHLSTGYFHRKLVERGQPPRGQ